MTPPDELAKLEAACHVALGVFGDTGKAQRVIPNKVFEAVGVGLPLITGDTPAVRTLFTDGEDCLLVPVADPEAIAAAVRRLRDDQTFARELAARARAGQQARWTVEQLGRRVKECCERAGN